MDLSSHFGFNELTVTSNAQLQEFNRERAKDFLPALAALAELLEEVRLMTGPLRIHSGFRAPELNAITPGSSPKSQHMIGQAADFSLVRDWSPEGVATLFAVCREALSSSEFGQLIHEQKGGASWVHLSLGAPWRDPARCREVLTMKDGKYTMLSKGGIPC